ncbi:MAG: glycosyltransferase family 2 protein [Phycisphaerales bacterium]
MRTLIAIPVYNEEKHVRRVLSLVLEYVKDVLVIDDGSTDRTHSFLAEFPVDVIRHCRNKGYGRSLLDAFYWCREGSSTSEGAAGGFDWLITMDCDEQHEPAAIPQFIEHARGGEYDVISGSRYLMDMPGDDRPPPERQKINSLITTELNRRLGPAGLRLSDSFCGFKAYRVSALERLRLTEPGYAFPMQFWVQAVAARLRIKEVPVRLIYNDLNRTFGGPLNDADVRLNHYRRVLQCELKRCADRLPASALEHIEFCCGKADVAVPPRA